MKVLCLDYVMNYIDFQTLKQLGIPCKVVLKDCLFHVLLGLFSNVLLEIFKIYAFQRDEPMIFFPHYFSSFCYQSLLFS